MAIKFEKLVDGFLLLLYDVEITANSKRNWIRSKIKRQWGGHMLNQSCYIIPNTIATKAQLESWGRENDTNIVVFGLEADPEQIKTLTARYEKDMNDRFDGIKQFGNGIWDDLRKVEENIDDPDLSRMTGFHKKIDGIKNQFEDLQRIIDKLGDEHATADLQREYAFIDKLETRFEKLKAQKLDRIAQGKGI